MSAPPGSARFDPVDVVRLPRWILRLALAPAPAGPPLRDLAAALQAWPRALDDLAGALPPARGERLLRLGRHPRPAAEREAAGRRLVAALFWPLVYELAPERWDEISRAELISPALLADLPVDGRAVVEVGAGSGRLTEHLVARAASVVAVEPAAGLRRLLVERTGRRAHVVAGIVQALPLADGCADVVVACSAMSSHPPLGGPIALAELERVARDGVVLVSPENPRWFEARGFERRNYPPVECEPTPSIAAFFGSLARPRDLLVKRR